MPSGNKKLSLDLLDQISFCHKTHITPGLYLVATPIGNLADISLRALHVLHNVDELLCEDTRETAKLSTAYGLQTKRTSYHDHNAQKVRPKILERLQDGRKIALVSDAGTPLISDPGGKLVQECYAHHIPVTAIPGSSACITAYILSGIEANSFYFSGFLPKKSGVRQKIFDALRHIPGALILYETHHRLPDVIEDAYAILGNRPLAIARELTKKFEAIHRTSLKDFDHNTLTQKGECVLVIGPPQEHRHTAKNLTEKNLDAIFSLLLPHTPIKQCVAALLPLTAMRKKDLYDYALSFKNRM